MDIKNARRKTFDVEFVEVTEENLFEVGEWCGGSLQLSEDSPLYIKLSDTKALNARQTKAFVGDFVLKSPTGFKSFSPKAFANAFEEIPSQSEEEVIPPARVKAADLGKVEDSAGWEDAALNLKEAMDRDGAV